MKIKNKTILYVVLRTFLENNSSVVLDTFATYESAQDKADEYAQLFVDKGVDGFQFEVVTSIYYDV
jgi:hypothetical protein